MEYHKLEAVPLGEPLLTRYCLVDATGRKLEVEGQPGSVALFRSYGKALARRRKGERVARVRVPLAQLRPTLVKVARDATGRRLLSVLVLGLLGCDAVALVAPDAPAPAPAPAWTLCTTVVVDTLWIDGVPHVERLFACASPAIGAEATDPAVLVRGRAR